MWGTFIGRKLNTSFSSLIAIEAGGPMQHLLFLIFVIGGLLAFDAIHYEGQYRTAVWQEAKYRGQTFNQEVESMLKKSLW
jgi:hypothetical protein